MGMFNSIFANLECPKKRKLSKNSEIQIKWQDYRVRSLTNYHVGDLLEEIENKYNNTWIRTDYICNICSKLTMGKNGMKYIKTKDQSRHYVFIRIEDGKVCEILTKESFKKTGVKQFVKYW